MAKDDDSDEEGIDELLEDDEITPSEAGFIKGEANPDVAVCSFCKKPLGDDKGTIVELEIEGELKRFCSEECAEKASRNQILGE